MGPTNIALVKYYRADQHVREAQARLDAATKDVRVQERKVNDLAEKHKLATVKLREAQTKQGELELDLKTRDAHIEKLRTQQQNAKNNKEYQAFLVEINTEKVDRAKTEEDLLKLMEQVEKQQAELKDLSAMLESERGKLEAMRQQINEKIQTLQGEIDALIPERDAAAAAVPAKAREMYEKLADRWEGEALSPLTKPDKRREEYVCGACHLDLVIDIYNKLHSRDDLVYCSNCRRILYIPDDLPPEVAIKKAPPKKISQMGAKKGSEPDTFETILGRILTMAAGESVRNAVAAGNDPVELDVF
ncbi:MAG TPA: C4-type zinc ribbon domain-containing protein, partial [Tepidisphaeraceae bacterium]|nr:C4-type zinc ribbon domain-containing protein [Tepidisphaeraceae bacterium]